MSYNSNWDFDAHGIDDKSTCLIKRIIGYVGEIWRFNSFDNDWDTIWLLEDGIEHREVPSIHFIKARDKSKYAEQFYYYEDFCEWDLFEFLNVLFPGVSLSGHWNCWESVGGYEYFYDVEYDSGKMCRSVRYGENNLIHKKRSKLEFKEPREPLIKLLAAKADDEGDAELSAILLDSLNKVHLGLIPSEEQKAWNLKLEKLEFQRQRSSLKSRIRNNGTLLPIMRDALLELSKSCNNGDDLSQLREKYSCARKMKLFKHLSEDESSTLLNALIEANTEEALRTVKSLYESYKKNILQKWDAERKKQWEKWALEREKQWEKWALEREKEQLEEPIKLLEEQSEYLENKLKQYEDVSLISIPVLTNQGEGIITKQVGAKIWVTTGSKTTLYLMHKDYPNRPRFKDDEQIVNSLSEKYDLCVSLRLLRYKISNLKRSLEKLNHERQLSE